MGEAKRRGTKEEREFEAIAKREEEELRRCTLQSKRTLQTSGRPSSQLISTAILLMGVGATMPAMPKIRQKRTW